MSGYLGNVLIASNLTAGVRDHFKKWQETYLAEVERLTERDARALPLIKHYSFKNELDKFPEERLPAMVIVTPGVAEGSIEREGDGAYSASWDLGIAIVVGSNSEIATSELRDAYAAATRTLFLQHPAIGDIGVVEEWLDENYDDLPVDATRTLAAVQLIFRVRTEVVLEAAEGTAEPLDDPYDEYQHPTVEETEIVA